MAIARFRSFIGIAKETVPGTPVASTDFIPITADPKSSDKLTLIDDKSWRGSSVDTYEKVAAQKTGSMSLDGNVNCATIGYQLQSVLPDLVTTGASAPYTHVFAAKNTGDGQPKIYTLCDFDGDVTRAFCAAQEESLSLKFAANGLLTYQSKWDSWGSQSITTPTPSYSATPPVAAYTGVVKVGGTPVLNVIDSQIDIKRKVEFIETVNGSQNPYGLFSGAINVTGKFTAVLLASDPMLAAYLANTAQVLDFKFTQGTASIELQMSKVVYDKADVTRGKDFVELSVSFEAVGNVTDVGATAGYSPVKVTLINAVPSATYA